MLIRLPPFLRLIQQVQHRMQQNYFVNVAGFSFVSVFRNLIKIYEIRHQDPIHKCYSPCKVINYTYILDNVRGLVNLWLSKFLVLGRVENITWGFPLSGYPVIYTQGKYSGLNYSCISVGCSEEETFGECS